jgi:hypothetical protein
VEKALFPGYFFLDCDDPLPVIRILRRLERFRLLLKQGDAYTPISKEDELLIRRLTDRNGKLNLSLIRDEIKGLINYLNTLFGKDKMKSSIEFLERLQRS